MMKKKLCKCVKTTLKKIAVAVEFYTQKLRNIVKLQK